MQPAKATLIRHTYTWPDRILLSQSLRLNDNSTPQQIESWSQTSYKIQTSKQTNLQKDTSVFVCLFVRCVCPGRPSYGWKKRDASQKFKGREG